MKLYTKVFSIFLVGVGLSSPAFASNFCDGFEDGYQYVKGGYSITPICPIAPITPIGSTPYKEGVKAGALKAKQGSNSSYDYRSGNSYNSYNDGRGNTTVNGFNSRTGSNWTNRIEDDGQQSGTDSKGRYWTYSPQSKTYQRSDGKFCTGVGTSYEMCSK